MKTKCPECGGSGDSGYEFDGGDDDPSTIIIQVCSNCKGTGEVEKEKK